MEKTSAKLNPKSETHDSNYLRHDTNLALCMLQANSDNLKMVFRSLVCLLSSRYFRGALVVDDNVALWPCFTLFQKEVSSTKSKYMSIRFHGNKKCL